MEESREDIIRRRGYRENLKGDAFSLYISSYPVSIHHVAKRIRDKGKNVVELCCGIGVSLEVLSEYFDHVVGVDNDSEVLKLCQDNLDSAGISDKVELKLGDVFDKSLLEQISADIVIYDVPFWSTHKKEGRGDLTRDNPPLAEMVKRIRGSISEQIVIFVSSNFTYDEVVAAVGECEFEKVFIDGKHDRNHIYLGNLSDSKESEVYL